MSTAEAGDRADAAVISTNEKGGVQNRRLFYHINMTEDYWEQLKQEMAAEKNAVDESEPYWRKRHEDIALRLKDSVRYPDGVWNEPPVPPDIDDLPPEK